MFLYHSSNIHGPNQQPLSDEKKMCGASHAKHKNMFSEVIQTCDGVL